MPKVLVTGGKGMLGSDLCNIFEERGHQVTVTDLHEMDIRDLQSVQNCVNDLNPDWIIHLAAMTHVDHCEQRPDDAYLTNTIGTQNVALAAQAVGAMMVYVRNPDRALHKGYREIVGQRCIAHHQAVSWYHR